MELREIHRIVTSTGPDEWNKVPCWGGGGPAYHVGWYEGRDGWQPWGHSTIAAYRGDVSLTMAWGADLDPDDQRGERRSFDWDEHFMDSKSVGLWVDLFWNGCLVDRYLMYAVDGGRALIPFPDETIYPGEEDDDEDGTPAPAQRRVSRFAFELGRLVHSFEHVDDYEHYVRRAGFEVVG